MHFSSALVYSQNTSLTELNLNENHIGDVGASGIGAGLACVSIFSTDEQFFISHATRFFGWLLGQYLLTFVFLQYAAETPL
jgi:hypothetical protein